MSYIDIFHGALWWSSTSVSIYLHWFLINIIIFWVSAPRYGCLWSPLGVFHIVFQCFFVATFVFSWKSIAFLKNLYVLFQTYCVPSKNVVCLPIFCILSQKYCVPLRNFVFARSRSGTALTWEHLRTWMTDSWAVSCSLMVGTSVVFRTMSRLKSIQGPHGPDHASPQDSLRNAMR